MKVKRTRYYHTDYKLSFYFFMFLTIGLLFSLIGLLMNFNAILYNGGKMPVYDYHGILDIYPDYQKQFHFYFNDKSEVNYFYLVDIIPLSIGTASIGDFLIVLGFIIVIINNIVTFTVYFYLYRPYKS